VTEVSGQKSEVSKSTRLSSLPLALPAALLLPLCFPVWAQQPAKMPRIGYLAVSTLDESRIAREAFQRGLLDLGHVEGKNIYVEHRYADGNYDRLPSLVAELVQLKVDGIFAVSLPAIRAAKQGTKTIPIVMVTNFDPVAAGFIDSLPRPGGNLTGLTLLTRDLSGKRLELLNEVLPGISRVAILGVAPSARESGMFEDYEATARALKIQLQSLEVRSPNPDLEAAFQAATKGRASALITVRNPTLTRHQKRIAELAIKNRLPSMFESTDYVEAGGLVSYAANYAEIFKRAAVFVDKILKGAKPADLPVEQPTKFELVINLKTAKQIGLTVPPNVLARADKVIK
jgi:putative ABC transport system substrate-binding protein